MRKYTLLLLVGAGLLMASCARKAPCPAYTMAPEVPAEQIRANS